MTDQGNKKHLTPRQRSWKRFKKNIGGVIGAIIIIISIFVAIFAYHIVPSKSTHADNQILPLARKGVGFKVDLLLIQRNNEVKKYGFFKQFVKGKYNNTPLKEVPFESFEIVKDSLIIEEYNGEENTRKQLKAYSLVDIHFMINEQNDTSWVEGGQVHFYDGENNLRSESLAKLVGVVTKDHIIQRKYTLGTDHAGRDIFSRIILGTRISLSVGLVAVLISLLIGIPLGTLAGYYRGWIDDLVMWFINTVWAIPTILLIFAITIAIGQQFWLIYLAVGLTMWVEVARIIRGQVLKEREVEYVEAARSLGYNHLRITVRHILPNVLGPLMVITAANFATAILIEAGLSYIGIGAQPPTPSWGLMLSENYSQLISGGAVHMAMVPGFAIFIMVLAFNLLGNGLRDALDVKSRT